MIQPQPEALLPESPPPPSYGDPVLQDKPWSRWTHHLHAPPPRLLWLHLRQDWKSRFTDWWVTAECITVLHLKKQKGQATVSVRAACLPGSWGHFKTAGVEQTDKLYRAAWHQADGVGLLLCSDLPRGYMERLHYHHPPPLIQTYIKSSPHPSAPLPYTVLCSFMSTTSPLQDHLTDHISGFSLSLYRQCTENDMAMVDLSIKMSLVIILATILETAHLNQ